jgi:ABC-2 type transport system ATP-binding protein
LLGGPEVLILDEPANGLDPEGMRWMRRVLRDFADRGGTVLLSSHLLAEVEAVADRMIIIGEGRIQAQGTRAELLPQTGTIVEADDVSGLDAALHQAGLGAHVIDTDRRLVKADPRAVAHTAMAAGIVLRRVTPAGNESLERLFFELTATGTTAPATSTGPTHSELTGEPV